MVVVFFLHGVIFANWVARIPEVKTNLNLNNSQFGIVLMGTAIGVISAVLTAGFLTTKFSSKIMTVVSSIGMGWFLTPLALYSTGLELFSGLFMFGYTASLMDISMNSQAVNIEQHLNRSIMSSFHASYSIGGFAGAGLGGLFIAAEIDIVTHFLVISLLVSIILMLLFSLFLEDEQSPGDPGPLFQLPPQSLWLVGIIALVSSIGEGAIADWSAIYLVSEIGTSASTAAFGFAAYSLAMTFGRLVGDYVIEHFSKSQVIRLASTLSTVGCFVLTISVVEFSAFLGFILIGLGLSVVIPLIFSHAGNLEGLPPGRGIAGVATIGYIGFLSGPPIIGLIAEWTSLRVSFGFVLTMLLLMFPCSSSLEN